MARKRLDDVGATEDKVRWNKKGTRKYKIVTTLTELKPKTKARKKKTGDAAKVKAETKPKTKAKPKTTKKAKVTSKTKTNKAKK